MISGIFLLLLLHLLIFQVICVVYVLLPAAAETSINQETYYTDKLYKSETVLWSMEEMTRVVEIWNY